MKRNHNSEVLHKLIDPLVIKFTTKDVLQVIIGASILAIPVGLTEETWKLGESMPFLNVIGLLVLSIVFISAFVYHNYYHHRKGKHMDVFFKRVISTYFLSFLLVAVLMTLIQQAPWTTDFLLALKRVIIVTFPASMSGTIADVIR